MIISSEDELEKLKDIGRICGRAVKIMAEAMEPGMTTRELDAIGRKFIEGEGAQSAPKSATSFRARPAFPSTRKWRMVFRATG